MFVFSSTYLPPLKTGSSGHAFPAPGVEVVACEVPCVADVPLPDAWGGGTMRVEPGHGYWITGLTVDDIYPNNEFGTFYEIQAWIDPDTDLRARIIHAFWGLYGCDVRICRATKTKPVIVRGVIALAGKFETAEGVVDIKPGDYLLESPANRGQMWPNTAAKFATKYDEQGVRLGPIPRTA